MEIQEEDIIGGNILHFDNEELQNAECGICFEICKDATRTFVCSHIFCQHCIVTWNFKCVEDNRIVSCPMCRAEDEETTQEIRR